MKVRGVESNRNYLLQATNFHSSYDNIVVDHEKINNLKFIKLNYLK